ncbi:MAG TPA: DM13 domain-containing protein [Candidatus Aquilonibacter sp.]|nr:DM13 domain-containing protein [Candidatus Aquilonibacter sp.]
MTMGATSWFSRKKYVLAAIAVPILVAAWWAFRPEKLWINVKVNEPAPFASNADAQPLYTGLLTGKAHPTSGRASVYQASDGKRELRLTDFATSNGPDVHVVLAESGDAALQSEFVKGDLNSIELGTLKANQGDQNYELPDSTDLNTYDAVVIYCERFHAVFGVAKLEKF